MGNEDETDTYESQLREVFESCDNSGSGFLDQSELSLLCDKLQLQDQTSFFIDRLIDDQHDSKVEFDEFKDCFVSLLTQTVDNAIDSDLNNCKSASDREVSPKFVLGQKKYGRRSRPELSTPDTDNDVQSDFSEGDILTVSYNSRDNVSIELSDEVFQDKTVTSTPSRKFLKKNSNLSQAESNSISSIDPKSEIYEMEEPDSEIANSDVSLTYQVENEEEYLRGIWKKLGVGKDGYLDLEELTIVCQHIGMDKMPDEVVKQLFEKLDSDQDGRVSFEEFLQGLFQHGFSPGSPEQSCRSELSTLSDISGLKQDHRRFNLDVQNERKGSASGVMTDYYGVFSSIDPENNGFADSSVLCDWWESFGLSGGLQLLRNLGFNTSLKINLQDLSDIFEEELQSNEHTDVYQYAVTSHLNEMQFIKSRYDQVLAERDKFKGDLNDANTRASILAQEVDDHHAKLEQTSQNKIMFLNKKYQDQIKDLQSELQKERELVSAHEAVLRKQLDGEIETIRVGDAKIKEELTYMRKENTKLEKELADLNEKYEEVDRVNSLQQKELSSLAELRQRIADMESGNDILQDQQYQTLINELETGREEIQELKDHNDELSMEVESLRRELSCSERPNKRHKRSGSWLADYTKLSPNSSLKRRESCSSNEEVMLNSDDDSPVVGKMRRKVPLSPINQERCSIEMEAVQEQYKQEIECLKSEYDRAVVDLQDSYNVQLIKLNAQLTKAIEENVKNDPRAEVEKLNAELLEAKEELEHSERNNDTLKCELDERLKYMEELEHNHIVDKNELITRMEREYDDKLEQIQTEWFKRLEDLRQESGDELDGGTSEDGRSKKRAERISGTDMIKQLEEQKLLMMRKYMNLKSQLRVTTEELEMALARETQAEELHRQLQKRCLKVEERLVQMASGMDTGSETSTEFMANVTGDDDNRPTEVISSENVQLKRKNALLLNRCEALERSLHAAKAREYFGEAYEDKTEDESGELKRKLKDLESKLEKYELEEANMNETVRFCKDELEIERNNHDRIVDELGKKMKDLQSEYEAANVDIMVDGADGLKGKLREDFDILVRESVNEKWLKIMKGGENELFGQLKEDFHSLLNKAICHIEDSLQNRLNEEDIKSKKLRENRIIYPEYENEIQTMDNSVIEDSEPNQTDFLLKDLFVENAKLVKELQVAEERQIKAEHINFRLQKKCKMLSKVLSDVTKAAVGNEN